MTVYTHYLLLPLMHTHKSMNAAAGFGVCGGIHLVQGGTVAVGCRSRLQQARSWHDFGSSGKTSPLASIRLGGRLQNPYPHSTKIAANRDPNRDENRHQGFRSDCPAAVTLENHHLHAANGDGNEG